MPRIASLYSPNQPSSSSYSNRHRRIDRNSYLHPPARPRSRPTLRFSHRPRTLSHAHQTPTKPSLFSRRAQDTQRPSTASWKSRFSFRSHPTQQPSQPLTLEEKLRIAANRVGRFERQTRPPTSPRFRPQTRHQSTTKPKKHTRIQAGVSSKSRTHSRKRDRVQRRLNTFASGKF